jgi:hypothetical protein
VFSGVNPGTLSRTLRGQSEIGYHGWEERWNFQLRLEYEDVAGKRWVTVGRYIPEHQRYEGVGFEALATVVDPSA